MNNTLREIVCMDVNRNCYNLYEDGSEQKCQSEGVGSIAMQGIVLNNIIQNFALRNFTDVYYEIRIQSG